MSLIQQVRTKVQVEARKYSPRWAARLRRFERVEAVQLRLMRESHPEPANTSDPLVSVTVPTYNRAEVLVSRAVSSMLEQTYENWELVIVGDHCTDDTEERLREVGDPRIRFINLAKRHQYPPRGPDRWRVAGSVPINRAIAEARGDWIMYSDDDVVSLPHRIEKGLLEASRTGAELVFGQTKREHRDGRWQVFAGDDFHVAHMPYAPAPTSHAACMYRSYLRTFLYDSESYKDNMPTDRDWMYRLSRAGVTVAPIREVITSVPLTESASRTS